MILICIQWLFIVKLFELEVSVRKMARQMKMTHKAVYGAVNRVRMCILSHTGDAETLLGGEIQRDEACFGGRRKGNRGRGGGMDHFFGCSRTEKSDLHKNGIPVGKRVGATDLWAIHQSSQYFIDIGTEV